MIATIVFLMSWIALKLAGDTPIGRFLHRIMVELPAAAANRFSRGHAALAIVVLMLAALHISVGDDDPVRMIGLAAPDLALWLTSLELGTIIEAAAFVAASWAAMRGMSVSIGLTNFVTRLSNRPRAKIDQTRQRRDRAPPANDDEGAAVALAG